MAKKGSFNTGSYDTGNGVRYLTFSWEQDSQSVDNNQTTVKYTIKGAGGYAGFVNTRNIKCAIDGIVVYQTGTDPIKLYSGTVVKTGTIVLKHDGEGKKKLNVSLEAGIYYSAVNCKGSGSWDLEEIPQKSTVKATDGDIGKKSTIIISRASANFTHTLTWSCLGLSGTIVTKTTATSVDFTIPTSIFAKIPKDPSATVTITCETFNGASSLGTKTCTFKATANESECKPILSYESIVDINPKSLAITNDPNKFIYGVSSAQVSGVEVSAKNSAYITSVIFEIGDQAVGIDWEWLPSAPATITEITYDVFKVIATDSRGYKTELTYTPTVYDYFKPTLVASVQRVAQSGNVAQVSYRGIVCKSEILTSVDLDYRYIKADGNYSDWINITQINPNGNLVYGTANLGVEFDYRKEHTIEFRLVDILDNATYTCTLIRGEPAFDWGQSGFNFNVPLFYQGNPMDFVVEQGTSGNWHYRKWYSGFAECHGYHGISGVNVDVAWYGWYYSSEIKLPSYPFAFAEMPCVSIGLQSNNSAVLDGVRGGTATTVGSTYLYRPVQDTNVSGRIIIYAFGRWK